MQKLANRSALVSTVGALPIALLLLLFPSWCLGLFGEEFTGATFIVRALCLGYLGPVILGGGIYLLMLSGHEAILRNILLLSLLLLIALDLILIPRYGANGAALAIVIVYVLRHLISIYFIKKLLGFYVVPRW
jgi:O-antigen/teichoic acid export membrane protein